MPNLIGLVLQDAQDRLQYEGSYLLDQVDATGMGRIQVLDDNWYVCSQSPTAGSVVSVDALIELSSVKLSESCP